MEEIRLQKYLAQSGIASRRKCEEYILQGKVKINNKIVTQLGTKINPEIDKIEFDHKIIEVQEEKIYILLNKPIGYVTTAKEQFGRPTVLDLIKGIQQRIVPVGRLDMYTSGALILTNDGEFINQVIHPSKEVEKTYLVTIRGKISKEEIQKLTNGIKIEDYITKPAKVRIKKEEETKTKVEISIHEGKNRQVRKMFQAVGKSVLALHRVKIGNIHVKNLKIGTWRYLQKDEIKLFLQKQ